MQPAGVSKSLTRSGIARERQQFVLEAIDDERVQALVLRSFEAQKLYTHAETERPVRPAAVRNPDHLPVRRDDTFSTRQIRQVQCHQRALIETLVAQEQNATAAQVTYAGMVEIRIEIDDCLEIRLHPQPSSVHDFPSDLRGGKSARRVGAKSILDHQHFVEGPKLVPTSFSLPGQEPIGKSLGLIECGELLDQIQERPRTLAHLLIVKHPRRIGKAPAGLGFDDPCHFVSQDGRKK